MKKKLKKITQNYLKVLRFHFLVFKENLKNGLSHSQQGEDIFLIKSGLLKKKKGFYIDIGAYHPKIFSDTYKLYKLGWHGINVDPTPNMKKIFKTRRRDLNLNIGISNKKERIKYYIYKNGPLNTTDLAQTNELIKQGINHEQIIEIKTKKLSEIITKYCPNKEIDFLKIDVEGSELDVLESNDWENFKPTVLMIEIHDMDFDSLENNEIHQFLKKYNYKIVGRTIYNTIYKLQN